MQIIRILKRTQNKIEQAKALISIFCVLSEIKLADSDATVLAYFMVYGMGAETDALIVKSRINTVNTLNNTKGKLKKFELIKKNIATRQHEINEKLKIKSEPEIAMLIKIDNK